MEFFDKKEEVMDIAMTRRGRELYAVGEFNPTYYAFADDEIIYESECVTGSNQTVNTVVYSGGVQKEVQNRSAQRIKDNMRVKLQTGTQSAMGIKNYVTSSLFEPHFRILGKSSRLDQEAPAWHVSVVNGRGFMSSSAHGLGPEGKPAVSFVPTELSGTVHGSGVKKKGVYKDASKTNEEMLLKYNKEIIPQINVFCDYTVKLVDVEKHLITEAEDKTQKKLEKKFTEAKSLESEVALYNFKNELNKKYGGDIIMLLRKSTDDIVLDFIENNVDESDLTLEVHKYRYGKTDNITALDQLSFSEDDHGPDFVEYFFDISVDEDADIDLNVKYVLEAQRDFGLEEEDPLCADKTAAITSAAAGAHDAATGTQKKGESCKAHTNCMGSLRCTNGICTEPPAGCGGPGQPPCKTKKTAATGCKHDQALSMAGTSCSFNGECCSGVCSNGKCKGSNPSSAGTGAGAKFSAKASGKQCVGKKNGTKCGKGGFCSSGLCKEPAGAGGM